MNLFEHADAREARDTGIAKHFRKDTGSRWIDRARLHAKAISAKNGSVTINDVRKSAGDPPPDAHPTICGAVFREKGWINLGYEANPRKTCHARPIARFMWVPEEAA